MSLLDDVSIVVTPNGYKAGELYAVVPVPTLGAEEVVNGDFATDTTWTKGTGWTIGSGVATCDGVTSNFLFQSLIGTTTSQNFEVTYTISNYVSGSVFAGFGSGLAQPSGTTRNANGTFTEYLRKTSVTTSFGFKSASFAGSIDNVSVKEYTSADMDVTRATAATRVDENGLVNYAEVIGDEEVTNGDFSNGINSWSLVGPGQETVVDEQLVLRNTGRVRQDNVVDTSKTYLGEITVSGVTSGSIDFYIGSSEKLTVSTNGTHTFTVINPNNSTVYIYDNGDGWDGYIDNVSVKEVIRDNVPRIDYTGGGCPHILAEPQRTNLITYSEDFTQWTKSNASLINTITSTVISPDGVSYANKLYPIGSATSSYIRQSAAGDCFSMFIKKGERRWVLIYGGFANSNVWFDSENGVFGWVLSEATATVESFGNDWYRLKILWTQNSTQVRVYNTDSGTSTQSTGNGTDGLYIWGAQLEVGSYATSYIPTSGSTVTRNQDIFTRDGIGSLINSTEGVLFVEMAALSDDGTTRALSLSDGTSSNRILIYYSPTSNQIVGLYTYGGSTQVSITHTLSDSTEFIKFAFKFKENDCAFWINGIEVGIDTSSTAFSANTLNALGFDSGAGGSNFYGKVKQLQVYDTALTDEQLLQLTGESGTDFYESYAEMASALTYTIQ